MEEIRVARATSNDAFAVAALHLQHDIAAGGTPEPGFLDRFADWWLARRDTRPTWVATAPTGNPLGIASGALVDVRPRPGRPGGQRLALDTLFVPAPWRGRGIGSRLLVEVQSWSRTRGVHAVEVVAEGDAEHFLRARGCERSGPGALVWRPGVRAGARA